MNKKFEEHFYDHANGTRFLAWQLKTIKQKSFSKTIETHHPGGIPIETQVKETSEYRWHFVNDPENDPWWLLMIHYAWHVSQISWHQRIVGYFWPKKKSILFSIRICNKRIKMTPVCFEAVFFFLLTSCRTFPFWPVLTQLQNSWRLMF